LIRFRSIAETHDYSSVGAVSEWLESAVAQQEAGRIVRGNCRTAGKANSSPTTSLKEQASQIQKVSAHLEVSKPAQRELFSTTSKQRESKR
jgi:hypothetical protein